MADKEREKMMRFIVFIFRNATTIISVYFVDDIYEQKVNMA